MNSRNSRPTQLDVRPRVEKAGEMDLQALEMRIEDVEVMDLEEVLASFTSDLSLLKTVVSSKPLRWEVLGALGYRLCVKSQAAHLMLSSETWLAKVEFNEAIELLAEFAAVATSILREAKKAQATGSVPEGLVEKMTVYRRNARLRAKLLRKYITELEDLRAVLQGGHYEQKKRGRMAASRPGKPAGSRKRFVAAKASTN